MENDAIEVNQLLIAFIVSFFCTVVFFFYSVIHPKQKLPSLFAFCTTLIVMSAKNRGFFHNKSPIFNLERRYTE